MDILESAKEKMAWAKEARMRIGDSIMAIEPTDREKKNASTPKIDQREWAVLGAAAAITIFW